MITTLILLNTCHWAADFTHLSTKWMYCAKKFGRPFLPIAAHAGVHTLLFFITIWILHSFEMGLIAAAIQWPTHFAIDVWKGKMNDWFPDLQNPSNKFHWWVFGFDQYLHQVVIIVTAYIACQ